jgi:outer membrane murein-binding lipoprotein Lpp
MLMAEEATTDVNAEIDVDIFADEAETPAPEESSTEETKPQAEVKAEEPAESTETEGEAKDEAQATDEAETEETETDQPKPRTAEARKAQLSDEIRTLNSKKNDLAREVSQLNNQLYRAQTPEELQEQGYDPAMAEIQALKQERQISDYTNHVTNLTHSVNTEALQVMHDFPVFDPNSPEYDEGLSNRAEAVYLKAAGIQQDPKSGLITQANVLPYEIYKAFAETQAASAQSGAVKGQQANEKMLARADTAPAATPKPAKVDPVIALWNED